MSGQTVRGQDSGGVVGDREVVGEEGEVCSVGALHEGEGDEVEGDVGEGTLGDQGVERRERAGEVGVRNIEWEKHLFGREGVHGVS